MFVPKEKIKEQVQDRMEEAKETYEMFLKYAEDVEKILQLLPDIEIPGDINASLSIFWIECPYNMPWFVQFKEEMEECGWEDRTTEHSNSTASTSRSYYFHHPDVSEQVTVVMDARDEDSVCQIIELGDKEVTRMEMTYEIICPEGENALAGEVL